MVGVFDNFISKTIIDHGSKQGCARLMSHESNLTRLWLKWVESSWVSRKNQGFESSQSRVTLMVIWVRVESTGYCLSQIWVTDSAEEKTLIFQLIWSVIWREKTSNYIRPHPPPGQQLLAKLGKMWWVMSHFDSNLTHSDSNDLSQSWIRLGNLGFELSQSWVNQ